MKDEQKTKAQLVEELAQLRQRIAELEASETGRKQAEEALRASQEYARNLIDSSLDMIISVNMERHIVEFNQAAQEVFGYRPEEVLGKHVDMLYADPQEALTVHQTAVEKGQCIREILDRRKNGQVFPAFLSASALRNARGELVGVMGVARDITQRKRADEALEQRAAQLALLNDIGSRIAAVLELDSVLAKATHLVQESFGYHHVALFTIDRERDELVMKARAGDFAHLFPPDHRLKLGQGMVGWTGLHGESLLANDVDAEPRYVNLYPDVIPTQSELSVPIQVGEELVGVLDVQSPQRNAFDENDVMVIETLADQIALAIENARLYEAVQQELSERERAEEALRESEEEIRRRTAQLEALRELGLELTSQLDLDTLLRSIVSRAIALLGGAEGSLHLYQPERDVLDSAMSIGSHLAPTGSALHRGEGLAGKVWETGEPLIVDDYQHWEGRVAAYKGYPFTSVVGVPVRWGGEFLGVLNVNADPTRILSPTDAELLSLFAAQAAIAIQNARLFEMERRRTSQLTAVAKVAEQIASILNLDDLLRETVELIVQNFGYYYAAIMLLDPEANELVFKVGTGGYTNQTPASFRQKVKEGMIGWAAHLGETLLANDVSQDPHYIPAYLTETESELDVPLKYHDKVIGVLDLQSKELNAFSQHDVMAMETLAGHIAAAIENAQLYEQAQHEITERKRAEEKLRQRNRELTLLNRVGQAFVSTLDLDQVLVTVLEEVRRLLDVVACSVWLSDPETDELVCRQATGPQGEIVRGWRLAPGEGIAGWVAHHSESLIVPDTQADERHFKGVDRQTGLGLRSILSVPLWVRQEVIGVLQAVDTEVDRFRPADLTLLEPLAASAAIAIENARLFQESQRRAEEMAALRQVNLATLSSLERDQVFEIMLDQLGTVIGYDTAAIKVITSDGKDKMVAGRGPIIHDQVMWDGFDVKDNKLVREMKETRQPVVAHDTHTDERYKQVGNWEVFRSWVGAPLFVRGDMIGYLAVEKTLPGFYDKSTIQILSDFARAAAIALENARLYEQARQDAETKSMLLREVNHRVKNNLMAIIGLLYAERRRAGMQDQPAYQSAMNALINQVRGLSTVHSLLTASEWTPLLLSELTSQVIRSSLRMLPPDKRVSLEIAPSPARVTPDQAHNLALIINELTTNTVKYALRDRDSARITVHIALEEGALVRFEFRDDGPGYPEEVLQGERENVGLGLIQSMVHKGLRGELSLRNDDGAVTVIQFEARA
jgi:PAS domain S-box-containing protein